MPARRAAGASARLLGPLRRLSEVPTTEPATRRRRGRARQRLAPRRRRLRSEEGGRRTCACSVRSVSVFPSIPACRLSCSSLACSMQNIQCYNLQAQVTAAAPPSDFDSSASLFSNVHAAVRLLVAMMRRRQGRRRRVCLHRRSSRSSFGRLAAQQSKLAGVLLLAPHASPEGMVQQADEEPHVQPASLASSFFRRRRDCLPQPPMKLPWCAIGSAVAGS